VREVPLIILAVTSPLPLGHGWRPADGALVWLVFTSFTDFLTPAFSDAGIVGAEIHQHPDSDGDHYAK
jgi:hypothetical protein